MVDELIENIEAYLRMNDLGEMSDRMVLDYIRMSIAVHKKQLSENSEFETKSKKRGTADAT